MASMKKPKEPNWAKIETEYVTTDISQRKLAEKHGISYNTIKKKSAVGGWVEKKNEHHRNVTAKAMSAIADAQARDLSDLITAADEAVKTLLKLYEDEEQFYRHLVSVEKGGRIDTEERVYRKADTKAMRDCVNMLKDLTAVCRDLYDLPKKKEPDEKQDAKVEIVFAGADVEVWSG